MDTISDLISSSYECGLPCRDWQEALPTMGRGVSAPIVADETRADTHHMRHRPQGVLSDVLDRKGRTQKQVVTLVAVSFCEWITPSQRRPLLYPTETASARSLTFSAAKMALVSRLTVAELMKSLEAISLLVEPDAIRRSISV